MRFLHISDLHLGKRVHEFSMLEDQDFILKEIIILAQEHKVDGLLISGDIYDKSQPPVEAVEIFDDFLTKLFKLGIGVYVISGNHDAQERIGYGGRILSQANIHLSHPFDGKLNTVQLHDGYGSVYIHLMPFLKPMQVRRYYEEIEAGNYNMALEAVLATLDLDPKARHILLAHQFVIGRGVKPSRSESEVQAVGGLDAVDVSLFKDFDYVALGHLHKPQPVFWSQVRYSGSPLKYSFSEAEDEKSAVLIELKEKGSINIETLPLKPLRDLRYIEGYMKELLDPGFVAGQKTDDYLAIGIRDEKVLDAMAKLRGVYSKIMRLDFLPSAGDKSYKETLLQPAVLETPAELFADFFFKQLNKPLTQKGQEIIAAVLSKEEKK